MPSLNPLAPGADAPTPTTETDEALRRVYGETAKFDRIGSFTLVHLDEPSDEERTARVSTFNPDEYFFDDCPLCQAAKRDGGHIVFDGSQNDDLNAAIAAELDRDEN